MKRASQLRWSPCTLPFGESSVYSTGLRAKSHSAATPREALTEVVELHSYRQRWRRCSWEHGRRIVRYKEFTDITMQNPWTKKLFVPFFLEFGNLLLNRAHPMQVYLASYEESMLMLARRVTVALFSVDVLRNSNAQLI